MFRILRSVVVMTTASIIAGVLAAPGAAHAADTTTQLSAASMATEFKAVSTTTTAAVKKGWRATASFTSPDSTLTARYVVDPVGKAASHTYRVDGEFGATYAVAGKGMYEYTDSPQTRAAVKMMRRPSVRYVFTPEVVNLDTYTYQHLEAPENLLTEEVAQAGTKTTHDDGSRNYAFKNEDGMALTFHVNPVGVLTSARARDSKVKMALAYTYGTQRVTLPAPAVTVDAKTLAAAVVYLNMPAMVKGVADRGAANTRRAAKGKPVNVASLRTIVRREAVACNTSAKVNVVKVSTIGGGIRVSATNPWTRVTVSYTVKASGSKVLVAKG